MRGYTGAETITIDGYWKDGEGIVLAVHHAAGLTLRLRQLLFAWHKASWYGSEVEERIDERQKLTEMIISPLQAMDYLAAPEPVRLLKTEWTDRVTMLRDLAKLLHQSLQKGWYAPDWSRWTAESRAWKLDIPVTELEAWDEIRRIVPVIEENGDLGALQVWFSLIIEELIATDEKVAAVWREAVTALGESALITKAADEEDWLVSIGLKQDNMPFRTALQLLEPSGEEGWRLRPAVQDRAEGGRWITLELSGRSDSPDDSETVTSKVPLRFKLHKDAPDEWLPFSRSECVKTNINGLLHCLIGPKPGRAHKNKCYG